MSNEEGNETKTGEKKKNKTKQTEKEDDRETNGANKQHRIPRGDLRFFLERE